MQETDAQDTGSEPEYPCILDYIDRLIILRRIRMYRALSGTGLHFRQLPILTYIRLHPQCTQNHIAQALGLSPSSIALSTKRLEKSGFLQKQTDQDNLRCKRLALTPKGESALDVAQADARAFTDALLQDIPSAQIDAMRQVLQRMIFNVCGECQVGLFENIALINTSAACLPDQMQQKEDDTL